MNTKTFYFIKRVPLLALFVAGFLLITGNSGVSAQKHDAQIQKEFEKEVATPEMLSFALNLKSAANIAVYGEGGVSDKGNSTLANGFRMEGAKRDGAADRDLTDSFSAINQLPCRDVSDADLSGKVFTPGVYCLPSADLTSRLILDGENNTGAIFVFRIAAGFIAKSGASIGLENGARAANVFFAAGDSAAIGEEADFKGNVLARNSITVGDNAMIDGRVLSVKGDVSLSGNNILGPQETGFIEICKVIDASGGSGLENRFFRFQVIDLVVEVQAGQCSGPISVPAGPLAIKELQTGRTTTGGAFNGNFQLTDVSIINPNAASSIVSMNLPMFTVVVNVMPGAVPDQTVLQFTNRFAITAVVEICKEALDSGVNGFFNFTINEVRSSTGVLVVFTTPVGQCSGPIAVVVPSDANSGPPRNGTVTINELPRAGYIFTSATTTGSGTAAPFNRLVGFNALGNGGGNATVFVVAGSDGGVTTSGATAVQTTVFFNNRTAPGQLKICKIAGPGIPEFTPFTYEIIGVVPFNPVASNTVIPTNSTFLPGSGLANTQNPSQGVAVASPAPGAVLQGGVVMRFTETVLAAPTSIPGGFCQIVSSPFLVDTAVLIRETGPATVNIANPNGSSSGVSGQARISRIVSSSGIIKTAAAATTVPFSNFGPAAVGTNYNGGFQPTAVPSTITGSGTIQPGVNFYPASNGSVTGVVVPVRRGITEVDSVSVAFSPVPLKICKIAGTGVAVGTIFSFSVTADTAGGLLAPFNSTVSIPAGTAASPVCDFATGPFSPNTNNVGSFNFGSTVTITEAAKIGTLVSSITSQTGGIITNLVNRAATITNMINGVNEVMFTSRVIPESDKTPPVITPTIGGTLGNNDFYTSNVTVSWNASDSESSVSSKSGCDATTVSTDTSGVTFTCSATSEGGTNSQSVTIKRDAAPPVVSFSAASPSANADGWNNTNVAFAFSASDSLSGIAPSNPSSPLVISAEGSAVTGSVTLTDNAGNSATFISPTVKIDKTAPVLTGLSNNTVDSDSAAAVNYVVSVTDNLDSAPLSNCSPATGGTFQLGLTNVTCDATDKAGNAATQKIFQVYVLASGKEATPTGSDVTVQTNTGTGLTFENVSTPGITTVDPIPDPATVGTVPGGFAISNAVAFQINTTATFTGSVRLAFVVPQNVVLTQQQFDNLRILHGKKDAQGNPVLDAEGKPILEDVTEDNPPTSYTRDFNSRTIYAVTTSFSPFYLAQQVNNKIFPLFNQKAKNNSGSVIPVKLQLFDANGTMNLSSAETILKVRGLTLLDGNESLPVGSVGAANPDGEFRFVRDKKAGSYYIYNLNTKGLATGKYALSFYVGNDTSFFYTVNFLVR